MRKAAFIGGFAAVALLTVLSPSLGDPDPNVPPLSPIVGVPLTGWNNLDVTEGEEITVTCDMDTADDRYTCIEVLGGLRYVTSVPRYYCPPSCGDSATYGEIMVEVHGNDPSFNYFSKSGTWANGLYVGTNPLCPDGGGDMIGNNAFDTLEGALSDTSSECGQDASGYAAVGATYDNPQQ